MEAPPVVLEVPVPPVEPKIEAFESLIRQQQEEALRKRGLPISLLRRGEKEIARHLQELEAAAQRRENVLLLEIQSLQQKIAALEAERDSIAADLGRLQLEKTRVEEELGAELRTLRAQLVRERDESSRDIEGLRAELDAAINRRKQLEASLEDKELIISSLQRQSNNVSEMELKQKELQDQLSQLSEKNRLLLLDLSELTALRTEVQAMQREREQFVSEICQIRKEAEVEKAELLARFDIESTSFQAQRGELVARCELQTQRIEALERKIMEAEKTALDAERRFAEVSTHAIATTEQLVTEKAEVLAACSERDAAIEQLQEEIYETQRRQFAEAERWAEEQAAMMTRATELEKNDECSKEFISWLKSELKALKDLVPEITLAIVTKEQQLQASIQEANNLHDLTSTLSAELEQEQHERETEKRAFVDNISALQVEVSALKAMVAEVTAREQLLLAENQLLQARVADESETQRAASSLAREHISIASELRTTIALQEQQHASMAARIQQLEEEKLALQSSDDDSRARAMQDEIARLTEVLEIESRARRQAEEEHLRVCELYATTQAALHQATTKSSDALERVASLESELITAHRVKEEEIATVESRMEALRATMQAEEAEKMNEAHEEMLALRGEIDYYVGKLATLTENAAKDQAEQRAAMETRCKEVETKMQDLTRLLEVKDTQVAALAESRVDLVERLQKEKSRGDALFGELAAKSDERDRLAALVERIIKHTNTSASALAEAQSMLKSFDLFGLESLMCAARQAIQLPTTTDFIVRQLEVKSEQYRLERLARKDAESDVALLRVQMDQLRAKEEESAAKLALERLEVKRLTTELAAVESSRAAETAEIEASRKKLAETEAELWRVRNELHSQKAEMTPLRERLAIATQRTAQLSEQAAAVDAQVNQSMELLVSATTPHKPRTPSRLSLIANSAAAMPSPVLASSPVVDADAAEIAEEVAELIKTNPLVQSRRRLMRSTGADEDSLPASPSLRRATSVNDVASKPLSPSNNVAAGKAEEKTPSKDHARRASIATAPSTCSPSQRRQSRTPSSKTNKSPRARGTSSFAAAPRAPFGK